MTKEIAINDYNSLDWKKKEACNLIAFELIKCLSKRERKKFDSFWILRMVKKYNTTDKITEEIQKYKIQKELFSKLDNISKGQLLVKLNNSF